MKTELGNAIIRFRKRLNWNQMDLCRHADIPQSTLNGIEHGRSKPGVDVMLKLTKAMGITPNELFIEAGYLTGNKVAENRQEYGDATLQQIWITAMDLDAKGRSMLLEIAQILAEYLSAGK